MDAVNIPPTPMSPPRTYHHGNLRQALIDAGLELAREGGPDAVVVREASRRVGVSHNAAYRHFPDRDMLLRAVCERCMAALARRMEAKVAEVDPADHSIEAERSRLAATGRAYVEMAVAEPGWFRTAFAVPPHLRQFDAGEGVGDSGLGPLDLLNERLDAMAAAGGLTPEQRQHADTVAWAAVHGLSSLLVEGPLRDLPAREREAVLERLLETVDLGLAAN